MNNLRTHYRSAFVLVKLLYGRLGLLETWIRWPVSPSAEELDALPVAIHAQGEGEPWAVTLDFTSIGGRHWRDFERKVHADTSAALKGVENLKAFHERIGIAYSTLWRAKEGVAVPESVVEAMGQCPDVVVVVPDDLLGGLVPEPGQKDGHIPVAEGSITNS